MTRPICLQVYISAELNANVRAAAKARDISVSEWVRLLLVDALGEHDRGAAGGPSIERIARQSVFLMVGVDALLSGHTDTGLRERAHQAFSRKCRELGIASTPSEGEEA